MFAYLKKCLHRLSTDSPFGPPTPILSVNPARPFVTQVSPRRNIVSVAKEGRQEMAKAFREGLLPHGDDDGGTGHTGADRSSAGQMR